MADKPEVELKPEKINTLKEVQLDAEFNFKERLRQQEEKEKHEAAKRNLKQPSEG